MPPNVDLKSPDWLCQQFDLATRRLLLRPMTPITYQQSLFLDDRLASAGELQHIVSVEQCRSQLDELTILPATFIFHVGHCGSTYLSRMLEQLGGLLALREPVPLRALAAFQRDLNDPLSLMDPAQFDDWLAHQVTLACRRYEPHLATVIKATSDCGPLARSLMATHIDHQALRVSLSLEQYLKTMLRSDLRRQELNHFAQSRLGDLHALNLAQDVRLYHLSAGELAAMCWLSVERALDQLKPNQVLAVDFDTFLEQPEQGLLDIAEFLRLKVSSDTIAQVARGEVAQGYSKDPTMRYNQDIRTAELQQAANANSAEIDAGLRWAQRRS